MKLFSQSVLIAALLGFAFTSTAYAEQLQPKAGLSPQQVVEIMLDALQNNNQPEEDAGIELTFRFAAPKNRAMTGPIERFKTMVKSPAYRDLINLSQYEIGQIQVEGQQALVPVLLKTSDGHTAGYMFRLGKQTQGLYEGAWMTDAVYPFDLVPVEKGSGVSA